MGKPIESRSVSNPEQKEDFQMVLEAPIIAAHNTVADNIGIGLGRGDAFLVIEHDLVRHLEIPEAPFIFRTGDRIRLYTEGKDADNWRKLVQSNLSVGFDLMTFVQAFSVVDERGYETQYSFGRKNKALEAFKREHRFK